ncbi:unnamed protein product [Tuber aestivum]|uniref:BRCT domain-containing protein n=1 Tax=Tuber aestivum TaxID=59557 RepID=A0A292PI31_9PEZI|nr:unnamed protein product [Tuber aestivum]
MADQADISRHSHPLSGIVICCTSVPAEFRVMSERKKIEDNVRLHGASYHPDLTQSVSHLVAAISSGKKYEFARNNGISIVTVEWLYDSLERGMALDESFYDRELPREMIGVGAKPSATVPSGENVEVSGKRKIRKRAEDMLGSGSQHIWSDIMGQAANPKPKKRDEWGDDPGDDVIMLDYPPQRPQKRGSVEATGGKARGIMSAVTFYIHGFKDKHEKTVRSVLSSHDATIVSKLEDLESYRESSRLIIIVSHTISKPDCPEFPGAKVVTEWWLETCLYESRFVEPSEHFTNTPFEEFPLTGLWGMEICLTRFTGIKLLHYQNLITLLGGSFHDVLGKERTLLISNRPATGDKLQFALRYDIPVVSDDWLEACVKERRVVAFTDYLIQGQGLASRARGMTCTPREGEVKKRALSDSRSVAEDPKRLRPAEDSKGKKTPAKKMPLLGDRFKKRSPGGRLAADSVTKPDVPGGRGVGVKALSGAGHGRDEIVVDDVACSNERNQRILHGCIIGISSGLQGRRAGLDSIARSMGADVVGSFSSKDSTLITHFIDTHEVTRKSTRDFEAARAIDNCHIVSADWLYNSEKNGRRADEKAYCLARPRGRGLEMDFGKSSSLSSLDSSMGEGFGNEGNTNPSSDTASHLPLDELHDQSVHVSQASISALPPTERADAERRNLVGELLGKLGKDAITSVMDRRKRPRGKLLGRASSNLSSYSNNSAGGSQGEGARRGDFDFSSPSRHEVEPPMPSQAITYTDPEAEKERRNVRAKLSGNPVVESPKPVGRIGTAVDVEVTTTTSVTRRRAKRK